MALHYRRDEKVWQKKTPALGEGGGGVGVDINLSIDLFGGIHQLQCKQRVVLHTTFIADALVKLELKFGRLERLGDHLNLL